MDWLNSEEQQTLVSSLKQAALCYFCQFRAITGNYDQYYTGAPVTQLLRTTVDDNPSTEKCSICFGILDYSQNIAEAVTKKIIDQGYHPSDYAIAITVPNEVYVREKVVELKLSVRFKYELKDVIREFIKDKISALGGRWKEVKMIIEKGNQNKKDEEEKVVKSPLKIRLRFDYKPSEAEASEFKHFLFSQKTPPEKRKHAESGYKKVSKEALMKRLKSLKVSDDQRQGDDVAESLVQTLLSKYPPKKPCHDFLFREVELEREIIYVTGRYVKLSREISQTAWFINGQRKGDFSIEEIIAKPLLEEFQASAFRFSGAGREDIDVRMLGNGRPFVVQLLNAKKTVEEYTANGGQTVLKAIGSKLVEGNSDVLVRNLQLATIACMASRQQAEKEKEKNYIAVVWVQRKVTEDDLILLTRETDLCVKQVTPLRVLHRRSLLTRDKVVHRLACERINDHFLLLRLCTSAGTYVKEFIHGDMGRTEPSISSLLGCEADIIQLDVESLNLKC